MNSSNKCNSEAVSEKNGCAAKIFFLFLGYETLKRLGQLTLDQRYAIQQGIAEKLSHAAIGIRIKRNRTVVWRELKRNSDARNQEYKANLAHDKAT